MSETTYKPYTIDELVTLIYEQYQNHFDVAKNNCDCNLHMIMEFIVSYLDG
jgi:hypothetical protein